MHKSIVIADQHFLILEGLRAVLANHPTYVVTATATSKAELREIFKTCKVDLLVFDPFSIGFSKELDLHFIRRFQPETRLIVVTDKTDKPRILEALDMGLNGFITKTCEREEILEAIIAVDRGEKFYCHKILDVVTAHQSGVDCTASTLTRRELEVVQRICEGYKTHEIATQLNLSIHTINTHRKKVLYKLGLRSPGELIRYAIEMSIVEVIEN